jgi:hypothetical protein
MEEVSEEDFDRVLAVNVKSVYLTAREIVPWMKEAGTGAILNIASTAGLSPRPRLNWYNASKGWMITATKTMAVELAPEGIRVNALCPVAGETPLLKSFMGEDTPEVRAKFLSTIPIGRFSTPAGHGRGGGVPVLRRGLDDHRHGARGRWRALHMTGFVRRDLPADIAVFAGDFASQPLAFAHLLDAAPLLDLTHVEVIREAPETRLGRVFRALHRRRHPHRRRPTRHADPDPARRPRGPDCPLAATAASPRSARSRHRPAHGRHMIVRAREPHHRCRGPARRQCPRRHDQDRRHRPDRRRALHRLGQCHGRRPRHAGDRPSRPRPHGAAGRRHRALRRVRLRARRGAGVSEGLRAAGRGFPVHGMTVPIVPTAIILDLANGGAKDWATSPYPALGRTALEAASEVFALGSEGAGTGAMIADLKGGLGSASATWNGYTVGALVAANPVGQVTVGDGPHFLAAPLELGDEFGGLGPARAFDPTVLPPTKVTASDREATAIAVVATDAALSKAQAARLATMAQDGIARAIWPSHAPMDGDTVFAVATGARQLPDGHAPPST